MDRTSPSPYPLPSREGSTVGTMIPHIILAAPSREGSITSERCLTVYRRGRGTTNTSPLTGEESLSAGEADMLNQRTGESILYSLSLSSWQKIADPRPTPYRGWRGVPNTSPLTGEEGSPEERQEGVRLEK